MTFPQRIAQAIGRQGLIRSDGLYVVALSGGPDSVALLRVLLSLGHRVEAAHCNFHLRGEESDRDENFCVALCRRLGVELHRAHFDTRAYAAAHRVSIEMAARELRYGYFEQLRQAIGADDICVAHHRDDQVETVLLNLVRGTGLAGLQGMQPRNGHVIRPMLGVSRQEVTDYLQAMRQDFVTDSTNFENDMMRNRLRLDVIPLLEAMNSAFKENVARMTEHLQEVGKVVDAALRQQADTLRSDDGGYDLKALSEQPSPEYLLWTIVARHGFNRTQAEEMLVNRRSGAQWSSPENIALADRTRLYIVGRKAWEQVLPTLRIPEAGIYVYPETLDLRAYNNPGQGKTRFNLALTTIDNHFKINKSIRFANIDADKVKFPLMLRPTREGDRFVPFGMTGSKLISDFLADCKVSLVVRRRQLVLTDANGRIVWLVGHRIDSNFALDEGRSTTALLVSLK